MLSFSSTAGEDGWCSVRVPAGRYRLRRAGHEEEVELEPGARVTRTLQRREP